MEDGENRQESENLKEGKTSGQDARKSPKPRKRRNRVRMAIGLVLILAGIGIFSYPLIRQAKSADFNKQAIDMILTPSPTKAAGEKATPSPEAEQTAASQPTATPQPTAASQPTVTSPPEVSVPEITPEAGESGEQGDDLPADEDPTPSPEVTDEPEVSTTKPNRLGNRTILGVIQIERIDLIYAIVEGTETEDIGVAIGHMEETAGLGEIGNCALAGHRGGYSGQYFRDIDKLKAGDEVVITRADGEWFTYKVTETFIVEPTDVWVVEDPGDGKALLTLITCEDDGTTRLIVRCELSE